MPKKASSDPGSALFVCSGSFHHFLRPANAELVSGGPFPLPRPGVDRPLRGNCHPLSCAPDNQVRCVFGSAPCSPYYIGRPLGSAPYQKQASTVRNAHSVFKNGFWCTRRVFKGTLCKKQASGVPNGNSVQKKGFWCTEVIFGTGKGLLVYRTHLQRCAEQHLPQRTQLQRPAGQPPAASDTSSVRKRPPRSEVSKYKKRMTSKSVKTF